LKPWPQLLLPGLLAFAATSSAQTPLGRRNSFNDPFFQFTNALPSCPVPAGPFVTESERQVQAHHRAERGTSCWLAGTCDKPNFYAYDEEIAGSLRNTLRGQPWLANTSLWATVQGRVVYFEGCAKDESVAQRLEAIARTIPLVQHAIAAISTGAGSRPRYKVRAQQ
jgi:BON domain